MGKIRDSQRTRERILDAAAREFAQRGFDGTVLSAIARRARVSKQLILHYFASKEKLFRVVLNDRFQTTIDPEETFPDDLGEMIAERFRKRAGHLQYIRFMTWEAASSGTRTLPAHDARQRRISELGAMLKEMQLKKRLPKDIDIRLLQLAVLSLCTYPLAFGQVTELVTGRSASDLGFQNEWSNFLKLLGHRLLASEPVAVRVPSRAARKPRATRPA
jgi:AcrR family transcriptional regulator